MDNEKIIKKPEDFWTVPDYSKMPKPNPRFYGLGYIDLMRNSATGGEDE